MSYHVLFCSVASSVVTSDAANEEIISLPSWFGFMAVLNCIRCHPDAANGTLSNGMVSCSVPFRSVVSCDPYAANEESISGEREGRRSVHRDVGEGRRFLDSGREPSETEAFDHFLGSVTVSHVALSVSVPRRRRRAQSRASFLESGHCAATSVAL